MFNTWITSPPTADDLISLLTPSGITPLAIETLFEQTALAYLSESRFYHTLAHIGHVLKVTEFLINSGDYPLTHRNYLALKLAAWFHDVVYDPRRNDNEEQSVTWMMQALAPLNLPTSLLITASNLVLATRSHTASPDDIPAQILLDADLSILGAPSNRYARYSAAIRQEYAFVPDDAYHTGRRAVLEKFLARPQIYFTHLAYTTLEKQARINLEDEIRRLE